MKSRGIEHTPERCRVQALSLMLTRVRAIQAINSTPLGPLRERGRPHRTASSLWSTRHTSFSLGLVKGPWLSRNCEGGGCEGQEGRQGLVH